MTWESTRPHDAQPPIELESFYGSLSVDKFRQLYRLPAELPGEVIREQLLLGALRICRELATWRKRRSEARLADVEQLTVDGKGELEVFFERACFCEAKAEILRETVTIDRRAQAENAAKSGPETEAWYRAMAADAVAYIVKVPRIDVEII